jgi:hypothetical protein
LIDFDSNFNRFPAAVPGYSDMIDNPMDLSRMEEKIENHLYASRAEFIDDFHVMVENCEEYNGDGGLEETADQSIVNRVLPHMLYALRVVILYSWPAR